MGLCSVHLNGSKQPEQLTPQVKLLQARLAVVEGLYSDVEYPVGNVSNSHWNHGAAYPDRIWE